MNRRPLSLFLTGLLGLFSCTFSVFAEENFLLINGTTNEVVLELGPHVDERVTPCSTFKMALSLMGYDAGVLQDEMNPVWHFQEGYDDFLEAWKHPQTPQSWMQYSCIWYAKLIALQLGKEQVQDYLTSFEYGNQDLSGGLAQPGPINPPWVKSSLKISPKEQVEFIQKMIHRELPVSSHAVDMTREILFKEDLADGWKLFGKTGWTGTVKDKDSMELEVGWFVGWVEKGDLFFPFAYNIQKKSTNPAERIPRVIQLLVASNILPEA